MSLLTLFSGPASNTLKVSWLEIQAGAAGGGGTVVAPAKGSLSLSGKVPTVVSTDNRTIGPAKGALALTGKVPTVTLAQYITPAKGALSLSGKVPTVVSTDNRTIGPAKGALALTGKVPTVTQSAAGVAQPLKGALVYTGGVPTVARTDNQIVMPSKGSLVLTGKVPTVAPNVAPSSTLDIIYKLLSNRQELQASTGKYVVYDNDGVTVLYQAAAWANAAGTIPYSGGTLQRIDRLA